MVWNILPFIWYLNRSQGCSVSMQEHEQVLIDAIAQLAQVSEDENGKYLMC